MTVRRRLSSLALFAFLLASGLALAQVPAVLVSVVDAMGEPVPTAEVVIEPRGAGYVVTVIAPGFAPWSRQVAPGQRELRVVLSVAPISTTVTVTGERNELATIVDRAYERNKSVTAIQGEDLVNLSTVANYAALRLLPGVMNSGSSGRDRFSLPTSIRGGHAWGIVETVDQYPAINITPVAAEDGGYTAGFSSIIPSIAVQSLSLTTGGLGVSYGQASGGVVRNRIKRGSVANPAASLRLEAMTLGEGLAMGDAGGGVGRVDVYVAGQTSLGEYGDAYSTFARPIQSLRLASGLAKMGVRTSNRSRWETMYIGGTERHDYYQDAVVSGQPMRRDYHTDKKNQFLASRFDWRPSANLGVGFGVTQSWFHENRIEDAANGVAVDISRRNRPQRATRAFATVNWSARVSEAVTYTGSGGTDLTWDRFEDITMQPIAFDFREQAAYWRNSLALGESVTLNGGVRLANVHNGFRADVRTLYDGGAAWVAPRVNTRLYGSFSTGYKLNKAFYLWWGNGQFIRRPGSVGLEPSETKTVEAGIEQPVSLGRAGLGTVRVAVFSTREEQLFNFGDTLSGVPFYDDARTRGAEMWTEWRVRRVRPFASFTWLRSYRDRSTNPAATNVDLRFAPLPNYAVGFGSHVDVHRTLTASVSGFYDDGGVTEQLVNDDVVVSRFTGFARVNASMAWAASQRWGLFSRVDNLLNRRNMGFDRTVLSPDGSVQRIAGTQRDPGTVVSAGLNLQF